MKLPLIVIGFTLRWRSSRAARRRTDTTVRCVRIIIFSIARTAIRWCLRCICWSRHCCCCRRRRQRRCRRWCPHFIFRSSRSFTEMIRKKWHRTVITRCIIIAAAAAAAVRQSRAWMARIVGGAEMIIGSGKWIRSAFPPRIPFGWLVIVYTRWRVCGVYCPSSRWSGWSCYSCRSGGSSCCCCIICWMHSIHFGGWHQTHIW